MFDNFSYCQTSLPIVTYERLGDYYFTRVNFPNLIFQIEQFVNYFI